MSYALPSATLLESPRTFEEEDFPALAAVAVRPLDASMRMLRGWSQDLAMPGAWSEDAWRAVAPAVVRVAGWPGHDLRLETEAGHQLISPEAVWPTKPGRQALTLRQAPAGPWRATSHGSGEGPPADPGDSFFSAILQALPWRGARLGPQFASADTLRAAASAVLVAAVADEVHRRVAPAVWLRDLLASLPHRLQRPQTTGAASASASVSARKGLAAVTITPGPTPPALCGRLIHRAYEAADRGDLHKACQLIEGIWPRSSVPVKLIGRLCKDAVAAQNPAAIERMATLIERLAQAPSDLFLPALGMIEGGKTLDLHGSALHPPFAPGHVNERATDAGLSSDLARVLFRLHDRRGRIRAGMRFVVGRHGTGKLEMAISECLSERNFVPSRARRQGSEADAEGVVIAAERSDDARWAHEDIAHSGPLVCISMRRVLGELSRGENEEQCLHFASNVIHGAGQWEDVERLFRLVKDHAELSASQANRLLLEMGRRCVQVAAWRELDEVLSEMKQRWVGALPEDNWVVLIAAAPLKDRWKIARAVYERRCKEPEPLSQSPVIALSSMVACAADVDAAWELFRNSWSKRLPADQRGPVLASLLQSTAYRGARRQATALLAELETQWTLDAVEVRRARLAMACKTPFGDPTSWLAALRQRGETLDVPTWRALVRWYLEQQSWDAATDALHASMAAPDGIYRPALGWIRTAQGTDRIELFNNRVYCPQPPRCPRDRLLTSWEALAILLVHLKADRLAVGTELAMRYGTGPEPQIDVEAHLKRWGFRLTDIVSPTGVFSRFKRVEAIPRARALSPSPQADSAFIAAHRSALPSKPMPGRSGSVT